MSAARIALLPSVLWALGSIAAAQDARIQVAGNIAFVDVNVVRMTGPEVLRAQTVVVAKGRIVHVGPTAAITLARGVRRLDGRGRYLVPGLIERDGHFPDRSEPYERDDVLFMYLAHGVTSVRAPLTNPSQTNLQREIEKGHVLGPRLIVAASAEEGHQAKAQIQPGAPAWAHERLLGRLRSPGVPYERLHDVTAGAAAALGLTDGSGTVTTGSPADLLLLEANPLENLAALDRLAGIMVRGQWLPAATLAKSIQDRAKELVTHYYEQLPARGSVSAFCTGSPKEDCFGGDPDCGIRPLCASDFVAARREALLVKLEFLAAAFPGSDWIVGQAVNFAAKQRARARGIAVADGCRGTLWWCQALRGYARHLQVQGSGHALLDSALANAPFIDASLKPVPAWAYPPVALAGDRGIHCEWTDLQYLIPPSMSREYERLTCGVETEFHHRFWWLTDPLWSSPGNERRDEHFVRNIEMRLHDEILRLVKFVPPTGNRRARFTDDYHPQSHHAVIIATGLPNSWRPATGGGVVPQRASEFGGAYVNGGYGFIPDARVLRNPVASTAEDWALRWNVGHERMLTREHWYGLDLQFVMLRRGQRLLALAGVRLPVQPDSVPNLSAVLALGRPSDLTVQLAPMHVDSNGVARASATVEQSEWLASFEVISDSARWRARFGAPAPPLRAGFGLSDPVLLDERFERERLPLLDALLPSTRLASRTRVGLYVEVYGVQAEESLQISFAAKPADASLLGRIADVIGLAGLPMRASWVEPAELAADNVMQRFVSLDLSSLEPGGYRLIVTARRADGSMAEASRLITILPASP